ncbi:hypothetical protein THAOC_24471 [Thalassiosira oceanica]|uniref:Uncharacterized protein n=1 Tax=Thalassiosira oceanica TaxID=159749 RepID=K0RRX6_THAOC|nr:hypothetical protein THAOC_24471 [Thalassiosira oceanica]|eukprot:EJK55760.1 hypothetical protein THAOC_24471 [Thalassiosira oceanica]
MCPKPGLLKTSSCFGVPCVPGKHWSLEVLGRLKNTSAGPQQTAHCVRCLHHGEGALGRDNGLCLASRVLWGSFDRDYAEKLAVEAFEEDKTRARNEARQKKKCFVFSVDSDEDVLRRCRLSVTKPYVSKTGVDGRPHLGVPGKITGSVESGDLPEIISAVGPYKTAQLWDVGRTLHHGELLEGTTMDFALLPEYFGGSCPSTGRTMSMQRVEAGR